MWSITFTSTGGTTAKLTQTALGVIPIVEPNLNFKIYPNPTVSTICIEFNLRKPENVQITVFDVMGRIVTQLPQQEIQSGINKVIIDLSSFRNGVYFCQLNSNNKSQIIKLMKY